MSSRTKYSDYAPWWWWEARRSIHVTETTTMLLIGIIVALVAYLCWLLFTLAVNALPLYAGVTAGLMSYQFGSGATAAILVGSIVGCATHFTGRLVAMLPWPSARTAITLLFAAPAGFAGYHAAFGLAQIGAIDARWRHAVAVAGAIAVASIAALRMLLDGPPEAGRDLAAVTSARLRASSTDRRAVPRPRPDWHRSAG